MSAHPITSLDDLAANPERAVELTPPQRQVLAQRSAAVSLLLATVPLDEVPATNGDDGGPLVDCGEAARLIGLAPETLRKKKNVPFRVKVLGHAVRYSVSGIERYKRTRKGR